MTSVATGPAPAAADEPASRSWRGWLLAHAGAVLLLSALYAVTSFSAEEPNIGAGFFALLLDVAGLPWPVFGLFSTGDVLPADGAVLGAPILNLAIHAALWFGLSRRRPRVGWRVVARRRDVLLLMGSSLPVLVMMATAVASERNEATLREQAEQLLPLVPWSAKGTQVPSYECWFCAPQSVSTSAVRLSASLPSEPELLAGIDGQLGERGAAPEGSWDCADVRLDAARFRVEAGPERRRQCFRSFTTDRASVFVAVTFHRDASIDPELRLDVTKAGR